MEDLLAIWALARNTRVHFTHNLEEATQLADRIVVLSRRSGHIRELLQIDVPIAERCRLQYAALLTDVHRSL